MDPNFFSGMHKVNFLNIFRQFPIALGAFFDQSATTTEDETPTGAGEVFTPFLAHVSTHVVKFSD